MSDKLTKEPSKMILSLLQEYFPDRRIEIFDNDFTCGLSTRLKKGNHTIGIEFYREDFDPLKGDEGVKQYLIEKIRFAKRCHDDESIDNGIKQHGNDFYPVGAINNEY